ncbi:MAG TPA: hypothetical protein ENN69_08550 [Spirochaetia bacterium]|nr:hypothetical protein [Spirochaetia bacterium]
MKKEFLLLMAATAALSGCLSLDDNGSGGGYGVTGAPARDLSVASVARVAVRHAELPTPGGKVLTAGVLFVKRGDIILGACWDFVDTVYTRAGFPRNKRSSVYRAAETGPFADPALLRPGDWVMYRNLPYGEIGHSAIFVEWIDFEKRSALTIEYVGGNRTVPGRFREADLTKIFGIVRGTE